MNFFKTLELIEHARFGEFILIRFLLPDTDILDIADNEIISSVIQSPFHHWRGEEEPMGLSVQLTIANGSKQVVKQLEGHKFYGHFDNAKITPAHYKRISCDAMNEILSDAIREYICVDDPLLSHMQKMAHFNFDDSVALYYLDLDRERDADMVAEWEVYDFFYAFIAIDRKQNRIKLIEFGLD